MKLLLTVVIVGVIFCNAFSQLNPQPVLNNPVVPMGTSGAWDDSGVWWPNVTVVNDTFYMFYNGSANFPSVPSSIGLGKSIDGINFTKNPANPILSADGNGFDAYNVGCGVLFYTNGTWNLYYAGRSAAPNQPGNVIGRANSNNPNGPWIRSNDTLLTVGSTGEWDDEFINPQSILVTDTGLVMYYWGGNTWTGSNRLTQIGMAVSTDDGYTWQKYDDPTTTSAPYAESDPVLKAGAAGSYDDAGIWGCSVIKQSTKWEMIYTGDDGLYESICYATSSDGITWVKYENNPVMTTSQDPLTNYFLQGAFSVFWNNKYYMYYDYGVTSHGIGLAISEKFIQVPTDFTSIQSAIDASQDDNIVYVDDGTYLENINFKGKAITVASHYYLDGDTIHIDSTIINGSQPSHPDSGSVVYFISGEDTNSVLCGFTITGGTGTGSQSTLKKGGGILVDKSGAKIYRNIIEHNEIYSPNYSSFGGGITCWCDTLNRKFVHISENTIKNNQARSGYIYGGYSGGVDVWGSDAHIENNKICYNEVSGGTYCYSPGIRIVYSTSKSHIYENKISDNSFLNGSCNAGGLLLVSTRDINISNNRIERNLGSVGAGLFNYSSKNTNINNNLFISNIAEDIGGGIYDYSSSNLKIIENNIIGNSAHDAGGIITDYTHATIVKNLIARNSADSLGGGMVISYIQTNDNLNKKLSTKFISSTTGADFGTKRIGERLKEPDVDRVESLDNTTVLINNTICNNTALIGAGGIYYEFESVNIINSILWGNTAPIGSQIYNNSGMVSIDYSNVQDSVWQGIGNISADPLFSDTLYHLGVGSPCIDAGHPSHSCNDSDLTRNDMGCYGGVTDSLIYHITGLFKEPNRKLFPNEYNLFQNYPNPFNPTTTIEFSIPKVENVTLKIYNLLGREIAKLISDKLTPGEYKYTWDASHLASGMYFYKLETENYSSTKKLIFLR